MRNVMKQIDNEKVSVNKNYNNVYWFDSFSFFKIEL